MKNQDQILTLMEKLFDAKLEGLKNDVKDIKLALHGDEKPGLMQRMLIVEGQQKNIMAKFAGFTAFFGIILASVFEIATEFIKGRLRL